MLCDFGGRRRQVTREAFLEPLYNPKIERNCV